MITATKTRIPLAEARGIADTAVALFAPVCERIVIAGSIRRKKKLVGDVELVCIPKWRADTVGLFGEGAEINEQFDLAQALLRDGVLEHRLDSAGRHCFGGKYQRVKLHGFALDIFSTTAEQWGVILAIRTGPAEFAKKLVTNRLRGGWLPDNLRVDGGRVWRGDEVLPVTEEHAFLGLCGKNISPEDRG